MSDYVSPFTISNTMLELVSEISEKVVNSKFNFRFAKVTSS